MLVVDKDKCIGCESCISGCPFGALKMNGSYPEADDNCVFCGQCVKACPCDAIEIETKAAPAADLSAYRDVWVVAELSPVSGKLQKVTLELLSEGRRLADQLKQDLQVLLLCGAVPEGFEEQVAAVGCDRAVVVREDLLAEYNTDLYADVITRVCRDSRPAVLLFAASETGRDLAPRVSAILRTGLTADCTGFDIDENDNLIQIRPTYGGNIMASIITPDHRPQLASVRPNVFTIRLLEKPRQLEVAELPITVDAAVKRTRMTGIEENTTSHKNVMESDVVVVAGYGVGSKENFKKIEKLAVKMGAAIGATRKVVDEGWAPFDIQVGQTGKTIAPDLYISFGVSGALQHTIGIRNAKHVIAVNSDPAALIFTMCDEAILGDCVAIAEEMSKQLER